MVWKKTINWPSWDNIKEPKLFISAEKDYKFFINHGDILSQIRPCLINMNKQTMRGKCFQESHNLRIITTSPFTPNNLHSKNYLYNSNKKYEINTENMSQKGNKVLFRNNNKIQTNRNSLGKNRYRNNFDEDQKINNEINS